MNRSLALFLIACAAICALVQYALPEDSVPKLATLPPLQMSKCDCGPDCCCEPCYCRLSYSEALAMARANGAPLVVYVNTKPHPIKGVIHCVVDHFPFAGFNVGVIVATPRPVEGVAPVPYYSEAAIYGPASGEKIRGFIRGWRDRRSREGPPALSAFPFSPRSPYATFVVPATGCFERQ